MDRDEMKDSARMRSINKGTSQPYSGEMEGDFPVFTPPAYKSPVQKSNEANRLDEQGVTGYCIECGAELTKDMSNCKKCGTPIYLDLKFTQNTEKQSSSGKTNVVHSPDNRDQQKEKSISYEEQAEKNNKSAAIGLVGFILLGITMLLFLYVDESSPMVWISVAGVYIVFLLIQRKLAKAGFLTNFILLVVTAVVVLFVFGFASTMVSSSNAKVKGGFMTSSIDSQGSPEGEVKSFANSASKLIAVGKLQNAPADTSVRFVWTYVDKNLKLGEYTTTNGKNGPNIYIYSYLTPGAKLSKGEYKVEIYLQQRKYPDETISFQITD